jgi:SAM-dependent methyltransferase
VRKISESYFHNDREEMLEFLPSQYSKVLEIGCGAGSFRSLMKGSIEYWGVDPSESAALIMEKRAYKFFRGILDDVAQDLPDQYFDLVVINDVMEHTPDHLAFLEILKRKLAVGGYLVGSIPNVRYILNLKELLLKKDWAYQESGGILDNTHLRFFTKKSLCHSLRQSGFQVELCKGINPVWRSKFISRYLLKRIIYTFLMMVIGHDTPYLQFAFCCRVKEGY